MTPERTDLIEKLQALEPSEGEWEFNFTYMMLNAKITTVRDDRSHSSITPIGQIYTKSDSDLISLAPQMRLAILDMAKEIEDIKSTLQVRLNLIQSETSEIVRETMIQNLLIDI